MPSTEPGTEPVICMHLFLEYMNSHYSLYRNLLIDTYPELATIYRSEPVPALGTFNSANSCEAHDHYVRCHCPVLQLNSENQSDFRGGSEIRIGAEI